MIRFEKEFDQQARIELFVNGLFEIQRRHNYWFESRHGEFDSQPHDAITNHVVISSHYPKLNFGYWADSELPENIREECNNHFDSVFNK